MKEIGSIPEPAQLDAPSAPITEGEWSVSEVRAMGDAGDTFMVLGGEGQDFGLIADVTMEGDAHLIAAAPELFGLARIIANYPIHEALTAATWRDIFADFKANAQAALNKAVGKATEAGE